MITTRPKGSEVCARSGWGVGTLLTSSSWLTPREICALDTGSVTLRQLRGRNRPKYSYTIVKTLPVDVSAVVPTQPS
jgi:hypothetical protein